MFKDLITSTNMDNVNGMDVKLVHFLRNLANSIENKQLLPEQLQSVGKFLMSYQFQEQVIKDNETLETEEYEQTDLFKFLIMGWYVYSSILENETILQNKIEN